jgi:hypothetical protein
MSGRGPDPPPKRDAADSDVPPLNGTPRAPPGPWVLLLGPDRVASAPIASF